MYLFLGDSHSRQFVGTIWGAVSHHVFSRASLQGISNKNSALRHGEIIIHSISIPRDKVVFMMFGGVDLDFSWPRQVCSTNDFNFEEFTKRRIAVLNGFLERVYYDNLIERHLKKLNLLLPQVSPLDDERFFSRTSDMARIDEALLRERANDFDFTQGGRAKRTILFNDMLEEAFIGDNRIDLMRIDNEMTRNDGILKDEFKPSNPDDHHASLLTRQFWQPYINKAMEIVPPPFDNEF